MECKCHAFEKFDFVRRGVTPWVFAFSQLTMTTTYVYWTHMNVLEYGRFCLHVAAILLSIIVAAAIGEKQSPTDDEAAKAGA